MDSRLVAPVLLQWAEHFHEWILRLARSLDALLISSRYYEAAALRGGDEASDGEKQTQT